MARGKDAYLQPPNVESLIRTGLTPYQRANMEKEKNKFTPRTTAEKQEFGKKNFTAKERASYQAGRKAEMQRQAGIQVSSGMKRLKAIKEFK